ncbi:MAG: hypothetical protein J6K97_00635, partial [Clostridia bacterium]|nr:hypothetical protein [Clostridia bacterium]
MTVTVTHTFNSGDTTTTSLVFQVVPAVEFSANYPDPEGDGTAMEFEYVQGNTVSEWTYTVEQEINNSSEVNINLKAEYSAVNGDLIKIYTSSDAQIEYNNQAINGKYGKDLLEEGTEVEINFNDPSLEIYYGSTLINTGNINTTIEIDSTNGLNFTLKNVSKNIKIEFKCGSYTYLYNTIHDTQEEALSLENVLFTINAEINYITIADDDINFKVSNLLSGESIRWYVEKNGVTYTQTLSATQNISTTTVSLDSMFATKELENEDKVTVSVLSGKVKLSYGEDKFDSSEATAEKEFTIIADTKFILSHATPNAQLRFTLQKNGVVYNWTYTAPEKGIQDDLEIIPSFTIGSETFEFVTGDDLAVEITGINAGEEVEIKYGKQTWNYSIPEEEEETPVVASESVENINHFQYELGATFQIMKAPKDAVLKFTLTKAGEGIKAQDFFTSQAIFGSENRIVYKEAKVDDKIAEYTNAVTIDWTKAQIIPTTITNARLLVGGDTAGQYSELKEGVVLDNTKKIKFALIDSATTAEIKFTIKYKEVSGMYVVRIINNLMSISTNYASNNIEGTAEKIYVDKIDTSQIFVKDSMAEIEVKAAEKGNYYFVFANEGVTSYKVSRAIYIQSSDQNTKKVYDLGISMTGYETFVGAFPIAWFEDKEKSIGFDEEERLINADSTANLIEKAGKLPAGNFGEVTLKNRFQLKYGEFEVASSNFGISSGEGTLST